jgi:hypothetical protein
MLNTFYSVLREPTHQPSTTDGNHSIQHQFSLRTPAFKLECQAFR